MTMKNPPHPGRSIQRACLEPLGLAISDGAKILGVTRQALNNVITGKSAISPKMAIRLTKALGGSEETRLRMPSKWPGYGSRPRAGRTSDPRPRMYNVLRGELLEKQKNAGPAGCAAIHSSGLIAQRVSLLSG